MTKRLSLQVQCVSTFGKSQKVLHKSPKHQVLNEYFTQMNQDQAWNVLF